MDDQRAVLRAKQEENRQGKASFFSVEICYTEYAGIFLFAATYSVQNIMIDECDDHMEGNR